eukprot:407096-Alexandrium_andersonii.AAC.1
MSIRHSSRPGTAKPAAGLGHGGGVTAELERPGDEDDADADDEQPAPSARGAPMAAAQQPAACRRCGARRSAR